MKNHEGHGIAPVSVTKVREKGTGPGSAGQSGDTQGLPSVAEGDSESVEELAEEGQAAEAELIRAMEEETPGEVRTRQLPEDDVPEEYRHPD